MSSRQGQLLDLILVLIIASLFFCAGFQAHKTINATRPGSDLTAIGIDPCMGPKTLVFVSDTGRVTALHLVGKPTKELHDRVAVIPEERRRALVIPCNEIPVPTYLEQP